MQPDESLKLTLMTSPPPSDSRLAALSGALYRASPALLAGFAFLAAWELYVDLSGVKPSILPAPWRILTQGWLNREALISNTWPTLGATLGGFALSLAFAFVSSILMDFMPFMRRALLPIFIGSQTLPLVAIAPLVVLWFGFGLLPKILLVALVTFFPLLVALLQGYEATDRDIAELLNSMKASRWRIFRLARLPSSLPYFFAGLRISITYAVVGAIFAEYAGAARGLGIYILNAKNNFRPDLVLAAVVVSAVLTLCLFGVTLMIERLIMPWQPSGERRR
ncbi:nitrate/sulfonate/bicarbonate ABC transporter permease protein [Rhizobium phaseoli]|nr:nitrate/sulfonate/bicarbonate ABC transporter permease protein [Rhizobium phaseoli]ANL73944.1 nitrate/sulfonate/bicarbonate ABC transporter permease protein [Rhizobium phaseoli]ANL80371.1 nitrate/sulfonate/bicarbonate ABC transporter permease protein [Rhizobium phaseoli]ANM06191.1 nitrate/sulfonate/bicarbonate ABC transporter permease protein [Rhizobium phaseoli]